MLKKFMVVVLSGLFILSLILTTGCSRHPNQEQIQAMEEARSACLAAEQKLDERQKELSKLQDQLSASQDKLEQAKSEKQAVQDRLSNWSTEE
jgi:peptidoglycan hydrolase CwlO-like protein